MGSKLRAARIRRSTAIFRRVRATYRAGRWRERRYRTSRPGHFCGLKEVLAIKSETPRYTDLANTRSAFDLSAVCSARNFYCLFEFAK